MSQEMYDAAIVGAGPAGTAAALCLARAGHRVIVLEAKRLPRDTVCGEFLSPECRGLLANLGIDLDRLAPEAIPIQKVSFTAAKGNRWEASLPGEAAGVSRSLFDARLVDEARAAGAVVCDGHKVTGVSGDLDRGFILSILTGGSPVEVRTRAVVGAQGKRSGMDSALQRGFLNRPAPFLALKAHFQGVATPGRIELFTFPGGYCGMSEVEGGRANVCLLVSQPVFHRHSQGSEGPVGAFTAWMARQNPELGKRLASGERLQERWLSIAQVSFAPKPSIEADVLMAGDAAGLVPPLVGDGISMAIESGQLAGSLLSRFLTGSLTVDTLRRSYPAAWRRAFQPRLRLARVLQPLLLAPGAASLALYLLSAAPRLGGYLISATRGRMIPTRFERIKDS